MYIHASLFQNTKHWRARIGISTQKYSKYMICIFAAQLQNNYVHLCTVHILTKR